MDTNKNEDARDATDLCKNEDTREATEQRSPDPEKPVEVSICEMALY